MTVRYMGTKRHMADQVVAAVSSVVGTGPVLDLFAGMGSIAERLADHTSVMTNDALAFTGAFARARFTGDQRRISPQYAAQALTANFAERQKELRSNWADQLSDEVRARQQPSSLHAYFTDTLHVANSVERQAAAFVAAQSSGSTYYSLATLYFSAGYFSYSQAIDIDAIRFAIDMSGFGEKDWLLSAWLRAASLAINSPGHTAQYINPTTEEAERRVLRSWRQDIWSSFVRSLSAVEQVGSESWRAGNRVLVGDALDLIENLEAVNPGVVYADPPYTRDQYSRFYHVYETLFRYDYPDAFGKGRVRSDRFNTIFSRKSTVERAFRSLLAGVTNASAPLVLSYPSQGLLALAGVNIESLARDFYEDVQVRAVQAAHSTLGASSGQSRKVATELILVCQRPV